MDINIRGFNSINASNAPLFVIDGVVGADINMINPTDIVSMNVLRTHHLRQFMVRVVQEVL